MLFSEFQGGTRPWYMPAFSFSQDTPLGATKPDELRCDRARGDASSPILLMNHWIDNFPPRPSDHEPINQASFLRQRIARCTAQRELGPGLVAVDRYELGDTVEVARELNARAE